MPPLLQPVLSPHEPETLAAALGCQPGCVLLHSALQDGRRGRYSFLAARPFLTLRAYGARCELQMGRHRVESYGDPWQLLESLLARFELLDQIDLPFPLGGCFGYWGYDLKHFVEPRLPRRAVNDLELPDAWLGFYDSLLVFDHVLNSSWIVSTGLQPDGSRNARHAQAQVDFWRRQLEHAPALPPSPAPSACPGIPSAPRVVSSLSRAAFLAAVQRAQRWIRTGDIYQVNLAQRLSASTALDPWDFYQRLTALSPAPLAAWINAGEFQLASSSPELFLRLSGPHITTRPIKGTRPRSADATRDAQLSYELQTSPKELAELVMITDLLRNDLGRVCEYGSVQVPELVRLERFAHVQHLVSTVEGQLRTEVSHSRALAACFPGGSITGAPKIRAMEIIETLEPVTRGPYTGALGYLGFNRESQLSILIRTAVFAQGQAHFHTGAGIVADSLPEAEYDETLTKAGGFFAALDLPAVRSVPSLETSCREAE